MRLGELYRVLGIKDSNASPVRVTVRNLLAPTNPASSSKIHDYDVEELYKVLRDKMVDATISDSQWRHLNKIISGVEKLR